METYFIGECECGLKRIRAITEEMLDEFVNNGNYTCPECESTFHKQGEQELKADKKPGEEREYILHKKKTKKKKGPKHLSYDNLYHKNIIQQDGMPAYGTGKFRWEKPIGHVTDALSLAIDQKDNDLIDRIIDKYIDKIKFDCWKYLAKKRKKYLKKIYPDKFEHCKI